jgi:acyl-coenzyme A synthetase/AMP-(fatty) acid ligase
MQIFKISKNFLNKKIHYFKCLNSFYSTTCDDDLTKTITNLKLSYATTYPIQKSGFDVVVSPVSYFVQNKADSTPNKLVYAFPHQGHEITYGDLNQRVNVAAQNLLELGFKKGDRIAIVLPNNLELIVTFLAACKIGAISTVLNPAYQAVELEHALKKVGAKAVVIYDSFKTLNHMNLMYKLCPELETSHPGELCSKLLPDLKHVFVLNSPFLPDKKVYKGTWKFSQISESKSNHLSHEIPCVDAEDPCLILFTVSNI